MSSTVARPLVSIGVPTRNRRDYLLRALKSIYAQTYTNLQIIVSDNESTDDTAEMLKTQTDPRLTILMQPKNIGLTGNFNACLDAATGEFFVMVADDDLIWPNAIEDLVKLFLAKDGTIDPQVGLTWGPATILSPAGKHLWISQGGPAQESSASLLAELFNGNRGVRHPGVMIRSSDARRAGGYNNERHGVVCDTANWGIACAKYPIVRCQPDPVCGYTNQPASETALAQCRDWQRWGGNMNDDIATAFRDAGNPEGAAQVQRTRKNLLANLTVDILLRGRGRPGWLSRVISELWEGRQFMLTPYVARRTARDGWKLLRS